MNGKRIAEQGSKWLRRTTRLAIYIRDGHACVWCGCGQEDTPHLTVDHVLACELGGTNEPSNLVTACLSCNSAKRSLAPRAWLRYLRDSGIDTTGIADRVRKHTARKLAELRRAFSSPLGARTMRNGMTTTHSIELASERARCTVKTLRDAMKKATSVYIHADRLADAPTHSDPFLFVVSCQMGERRKGFEAAIVKVSVPGEVHGGHTDAVEETPRRFDDKLGMLGRHMHATEPFRPNEGFWSLYAGTDYLASALACLPADAEISFEVYLDAGSCDPLMRAKVHADHLILHAKVKRGSKTVARSFMIDASSGLHNSARFGSPR